MPLTKDGLKALLALQERDKAADAVQAEIDAVPPKLEAVRADLEASRGGLDAAKAKVLELEKRRKARELDAAAKEEAARKHAGQLNEVKSNDAYKALQAEIDKERAAAGDIETEILVLMDEIDVAKSAEKAAAAEFKKIEDEAKKDLARLEAVLSEARGRHQTALAARDEASSGVPEDALKIYRHIRSRGKRDAVVPARDGHCAACQINLAPSVLVELAKAKAMVNCESCQRILYKPEPAGAPA